MKFICTHTDFKEPKGDYIIVSSKPLNDKYNLPLVVANNNLKSMQFAYAEGYMIYNIWTSEILDNEDWICINHYRRYLDNPNEETTLPTPLSCNMHKQYATCHNINDLLKVESIIDRYYPEYSMDYQNINLLYPCNMFILMKSTFYRYCDFVFGVLEKFNEENNLFTDEDVKNYVTNNASQYNCKFDATYQSRLQGFLMERIGTIFFLKYCQDIKVTHKKILITDNKKL